MDALTQEARIKGHIQRMVLRGCRDMLSEAAKQFRLNNDPGHAGLCELHVSEAECVLQGVRPYSASRREAAQ